jgi:heme-degrading monooxygenase HmoA
MAFARVVTFDGVTKDRMQELQSRMESGEPPEGFPSSELIVLHDADAEKSLVLVVFDSEDDYKKGDEILSAMPAGDTPGQRTSVGKYDVAMRMKN